MPSLEAKSIAVAVVQSDGRFLVGRRPSGVPLAGFAEFPGGKVEPGEEFGDTAVRECLEETGIEVCVCRQLCEMEYDYDHGRLVKIAMHSRYAPRRTSRLGARSGSREGVFS